MAGGGESEPLPNSHRFYPVTRRAARFDDAPSFATYCGLMHLSGKFRLIALVAAFAVGVLGLLPAAHVHDEETGATVHRHATDLAGDHHDDGAAHHAGVRGSEQHPQARHLPDEYLAAPGFWLDTPAVASVPFASPPVTRVTRRPARTTLLPTHDPPLRYFSSPAPPVSL